MANIRPSLAIHNKTNATESNIDIRWWKVTPLAGRVSELRSDLRKTRLREIWIVSIRRTGHAEFWSVPRVQVPLGDMQWLPCSNFWQCALEQCSKPLLVDDYTGLLGESLLTNQQNGMTKKFWTLLTLSFLLPFEVFACHDHWLLVSKVRSERSSWPAAGCVASGIHGPLA